MGRALTQWIEATGGGASVRVMQVLDIDDPPVEWEVTLDVAGMAVDQERVTARLGFDPLLGVCAVGKLTTICSGITSFSITTYGV